MAAASTPFPLTLEKDDPLNDLFDDEDQQSSISGPKISIETSQLLGGSSQFTHLVRGLDRTLLTKVRDDLKAQTSTVDEEKEAEAYVRRIDGDAEPEFATAMAKAIYTIAVGGKKELPQTNPLFFPGRLAFVWDLGFESGAYSGSSDLPTNLLRSRMEVGDTLTDRKEQNMVVRKVADAIELLRTKRRSGEDEKVVIGEDGKRRVKRKDKEARKKEEEPAAPSPSGISKPEVIVGMDEDEEWVSDSFSLNRRTRRSNGSITHSIFGDAGRDYQLDVDERRRREAEAKLEGRQLTPEPEEEEAYGPQIPAEFRNPRDDEEMDEETFGPQIPAEFRQQPREDEEEETFGPQIPAELRNPRDDEEMEQEEDTFGPQIPAEFRKPRWAEDEEYVDEEEEYRLRMSAASKPEEKKEEKKQVRTDWFGKVIVDGREVDEKPAEEKEEKIADLVRDAAGDAAAAQLAPVEPVVPSAGTKKAKKRVFLEDQGDYYTGLSGAYGYDSEEEVVEASSKIGKDGEVKTKKGAKEEEKKKKRRLDVELGEVDKKVKEKFGVGVVGGRGKKEGRGRD